MRSRAAYFLQKVFGKPNPDEEKIHVRAESGTQIGILKDTQCFERETFLWHLYFSECQVLLSVVTCYKIIFSGERVWN